MIPHRVADDYMLAYIAARDQRYALPSLALSITGETSKCHGAPTYLASTRKRIDVRHCALCRKPCDAKTWIAPKSGATARGGWAPGIAETLPSGEPSGRTWNRMHVRETRTRNCSAEDGRRAALYDAFRGLQRLIEPQPTSMNLWAWMLRLIAWEGYLVRGTFLEASMVCNRYVAEVIDGETTRRLVLQARRVVAKRLDRQAAREARLLYVSQPNG